MSPVTRARVPRLWRVKDPRRLITLGQLELPGFAISDSKTDDQAWSELVSATSPQSGRHARPGIWPAVELAGLTGRDWRFEHEDARQNG